MRATEEHNGLKVRAYAGSTGILLAMNTAPGGEAGLLGFGLERKDPRNGRMEWLLGSLTFPGQPHKAGQLFPTNEAPIQKYRWSDYRVFPDTRYEYTVHPIYGTPDNLRVEDGPTVSLRTHAIDKGDHGVIFNRAAAASQAFSRKFPGVEEAIDKARRAHQPPPDLPSEALEWLTRGLLEQITGFIAAARDETWALDVAIYEYELADIIEAINAAHARNVNVRLIYHARKNDEQTTVNEANVAGLPADITRPRVTTKIFHQKFIILSRIENGVRVPQAVLAGSTNFTHNGLYRQANVVHVVRRPDVASQYLALFEEIFKNSDDRGATKRYINKADPVQVDLPLFAGFSPRSGQTDLRAFEAKIMGAQRDVLFCTAFDLIDTVEDALLGAPDDPILRFGIQNSRSRITGIHRDRTASFGATSMLSSGLEGFLKESTAGQRGNILIHTKLIVTDFTSDTPTVISGSHNFSKSASDGNDENFLIINDDPEVADCYGCELMRIYDHYRFRYFAAQGSIGNPELTPDDAWNAKYFQAGSLSERDRLRFAGD